MKRFLTIIVLFVASIFTYAQETSLDDGCKAYLVGDEFGHIYYEKNIDQKLPLASVTKMMTIMVAFDDIQKGKVHLKDKVRVPKEIADIGGSRIWMKEDMDFTLEDLLKASAIYSANNATEAIAYYISHGNVDKFVKRMNGKLKDMNLDKMIEYHTPTGLPPHMTDANMDIGNARGLYFLSMNADKNKRYMKLASMKETKIKVGKIRNRNNLLGEEGIYGIKTGHHDTAGYNICIVSDENNVKLFVVVLGGKDEKTRDKIVLDKIREFHDEYQYRVVLSKDTPLSKVKVLAGNEDYVEIYPDSDLKKVFKVDSKINIRVKKEHFVTAPVKPGEKLGEYEVFIDGEKVLGGKLYAKQGVSIYSPFKKQKKEKNS